MGDPDRGRGGSSNGDLTRPATAPPSSDSDPTASLSERPIAVVARGTTVGRYVALDVIGSGAMGVVYRAWDPTLSRAVALKIVEAPATDPALRERRLREAQTLAQLSHPNVVAVHDVGVTDGGVFIAMELVDGKVFADWLRAETRNEREIRAVLLQSGEGLAAAHAAGLVHRDFKPANVMIGVDGRARVLDFGLARSVSDDADRRSAAVPADPPPSITDVDAMRVTAAVNAAVTQAGAIVGTPRYMAPEQQAGQPATQASDQFSFCVTAWEALFDTHPFPATTQAELLRRQRAAEIERPAGARVAARIEQALRRGLAMDPAARHPSLAALLEELRHDPLRRRRLAVAVAAGLFVAVALGAGWLRGGRLGAPVCGADPSLMAGIWDGARRGALVAAFAATHASAAAETAASVTPGLDRYAAALQTMRVDACVATRVRGDQSEHLMDLRIRCLDRRRDSLRALVDVLTTADGAVVSKAVEAVQALPPLDDCADVTVLEATAPMPTEPAQRARIAAANQALARVGAQFAAGRYAEGIRLVEPLAREAGSIGYRPLLADVELRQGALLDRNGDYHAAEEAYRAAAVDADAGRADVVRAEALTQLVWMIGERDGHYREARQLAAVARGAIDRLDHPDRVLARYYRALGVLDYREGKYQAALSSSRRATELARRTFGPDDPYVASCVMDMGLARYYLGDYDAARKDVEQALAIWRAAFGPDHGDVAAALDNLGEIERAQHHYPEAIAHYRSAAAIWDGLGSADRADALANIGEIERTEGNLTAAQADLERALTTLETRFGPTHQRVSAPLIGLARVLVDEGQLHQAVELLERALRIHEVTPGDPIERADGRFTLARALGLQHRDPARATALATAALDAYTAAGARGSAAAAEARSWLARAAAR